MPNEPLTPTSDEVPPGRYGNVLVLPTAGAGNATAEELAWPVVAARSNVRGVVLTDPPVLGNATAEELMWPVATVGAVVAPPSVESRIATTAKELAELIARVPRPQRDAILLEVNRLLQSPDAAPGSDRGSLAG